jgi:hypothetical protein
MIPLIRRITILVGALWIPRYVPLIPAPRVLVVYILFSSRLPASRPNRTKTAFRTIACTVTPTVISGDWLSSSNTELVQSMRAKRVFKPWSVSGNVANRADHMFPTPRRSETEHHSAQTVILKVMIPKVVAGAKAPA